MATPGPLRLPDLTNTTAKHLDSLKGGRFPIEVLVRGKDAAENEKLFVKITDVINGAGVSWSYPLGATISLTI